MMQDAGMGDFPLVRLAPAKVNLALHVVGQRADGYHELESLVTFADAGDRIGLKDASEDRFSLSGRFASDLPDMSDGATRNLVLKARDLLRTALTERGLACGPVHLHLEKNLPVASGIGGGSADCAATLLGLMTLWKADLDPQTLQAIALQLGADVPMCLESRPLIARGIGDRIEPVPGLASFPMLIVNPLVPVSTPVVFRMLSSKSNPPLLLANLPETRAGWLAALKGLRNDLEPPARLLEPAIGAVCTALETAGATFVRMSGSGASCFGLFDDETSRDAANRLISSAHPAWYVLACNSVSEEGMR